MTATATQTTNPSDNIVTSLETITSYVMVTVPSMSVSITETPIIDATLTAVQTEVVTGPGALKARKDQETPGLVTPTPLQTFQPGILSTACSSNIQSATVIINTMTVISTILQTSWDTEPYATIDSTVSLAATTTVQDGINTAFGTAAAITSEHWETNTVVGTTIILASTSEESSSAAPSTAIAQSSSVAQSSPAAQTSSIAQSSSAAQSSQLTSALPTSSALPKVQATQSTNICAPTIVLASPTALVGSIDGSTVSVDDMSYQLKLPFDMQIFDRASRNVFVSTNGVSPVPYRAYQETGLTYSRY